MPQKKTLQLVDVNREIIYYKNKSSKERDTELKESPVVKMNPELREYIRNNSKSFAEYASRLKAFETENRTEYQLGVECGRIIPPEQQAEFLETETKLFDAFCVLGNAYGLPIYPELTTPALIDLEMRIINALISIPSEQELSQVDPKRMESIKVLYKFERGVNYSKGKISNLVELLAIEKRFLTWCGEKVTKAKAVGTHIIATEVWGYRGILRYDHRDNFRSAPDNANAYWVGKPRLVVVEEGYMDSPVCLDIKFSHMGIPNGEYHVVPVKYFHIETRRSLKKSQ